jgi:hypothetical protein
MHHHHHHHHLDKDAGKMSLLQWFGLILVLDELKRYPQDIGKFDRVHHYHVGILLMLFA